MTAKDVRYIKKQLHIINKKKNEEELNKYFASLTVHTLNDEVKKHLLKAVDVQRCYLRQELPMAVNGDIDDII